jgi:aryl-alcohol dehydrogenase-like predicted oxidoreductase
LDGYSGILSILIETVNRMKYTNLGHSGLKVSRLCLGCMTFGTSQWRDWVLDEEDSRAVIKGALELGINFFDTADMYSNGVSEQVVGKALKDYARRDEVVIATKVFFPMGEKPTQRGLSRKHIFEAVEASLKRLGVDYIDLYQIHRFDYHTPMEETLEALDDLVRQGKVRYLGASSMFAWQFTKMLYLSRLNGWSRFISMQNHYNLIYREEEREMIPLCMDEGIGLIPWSPLARGFLAGNRNKTSGGETVRAKSDDYAREMYFEGQDFEIADRLKQLAEKKGVKPIQLALNWVLNAPGITSPIIGARNLEHLNELVAALDLELTPQERKYLNEPYLPRAVRGHD